MAADDEPLDFDYFLREDVGNADFEILATWPTSSGAPVVDWRTLNDADARAEWNSLREWVEWFTVRYDLSQSIVPVCWHRHGALVDELSALHAAHLVTFDDTDTGFGLIGWHERLGVALPRLRHAYDGGCSRSHQSHKPRGWTNTVDEQEWDGWANQLHT